MRPVGELALDPLERLALAVDRSFELGVAKLLEQGREPRARLEPVADQVVAGDQRRRIDRTGRLRLEVAAGSSRPLRSRPNDASASASCRASSSSIPGSARIRLSFDSRSFRASPRYW